MRPKTVTLICHGLITVEPEAKVAWEDVWVRYRHGGKRKSYGPTLIGRADLDGEIEFHNELQREHPEHDWSEDVAELAQAAATLDSGARVAIGNDWDNGTPTLYFAEDYFDRSGAEEMIRAMMSHLGEPDVKIQWQRKTDIVVQGISIPPKRLREAAV
jgi:hypothetical protein